LIGAAVTAAHQMVESRPSTRAVWLELLANRLDSAAGELIPIGSEETHLAWDRLQGRSGRGAGRDAAGRADRVDGALQLP